jgi:4-diphosphocytidyl-2-C-methyl-D-erythritol kinase
MPAPPLTFPAFAKINLCLRILGERSDGYHEISTFLQTISLHDTINIDHSERSEIEFWCDEHALPLGSDNLVVRAAEELRRRYAPGRGARIRLEKRIPFAAGLGGGSSNAAITLIGLSTLWKLKISPLELLEVAAGLGADVAFFLFGGTVLATGVGATIEPLPDGVTEYLLVLKPNCGVSTADAYHLLDLEKQYSDALTSAEVKPILSGWPQHEFFDTHGDESQLNDFESVVLTPEIRRAKNAMKQAGGRLPILAGSGSAIYAFFDNEDAQRRAIQAIELEAGWRVFPCRTVARNQYRSALGEAARLLERFQKT